MRADEIQQASEALLSDVLQFRLLVLVLSPTAVGDPRHPDFFLGAAEVGAPHRRLCCHPCTAPNCCHRCTAPNCRYVAEITDEADRAGRCLRPVIIGNGYDHQGHFFAVCAGLAAVTSFSNNQPLSLLGLY